jgi:hemerythrin-like domain-containing protein
MDAFAMTFNRQVSRVLDDEHRANLELLERVESAFMRAARTGPKDPELARLAGALGRHLAQDLGRHFEFEEHELFPRMEEAGDGDMAALLAEEHDAIRATAQEVLPLAQQMANGTLDDAGWQRLRVSVLELVERLVAHIQKETMALLPLLDDLLGEDDDRELASAYVAG